MPHHIERKMLWKNKQIIGYMLIIANRDICGVFHATENHSFTSMQDLKDNWINTIDEKLPYFDAITNI